MSDLKERRRDENDLKASNANRESKDCSVQLGIFGCRVRWFADVLRYRSVSYSLSIVSGILTAWAIYSAVRGFSGIFDLLWIIASLAVFGYSLFTGAPRVADDAIYLHRKFGRKLESAASWLHAAIGEGQMD
jgi:hypothetical protein